MNSSGYFPSLHVEKLNWIPSKDYHSNVSESQKLNFPTKFQKVAYGDSDSVLLFRTNQVNYNETINDLDLWRDGPTAYLTLGEENGKPVVSSTIVEAGEEAPDGYLYGPYLSVFTGYAE